MGIFLILCFCLTIRSRCFLSSKKHPFFIFIFFKKKFLGHFNDGNGQEKGVVLFPPIILWSFLLGVGVFGKNMGFEKFGISLGCGLQGCRENTRGEEREFVKSHQNDTDLVSFFFLFLSNKGIFVTLYIQNVVLSFSSIFTVTTNGGGHFIRG
jgi:hypothetical protein